MVVRGPEGTRATRHLREQVSARVLPEVCYSRSRSRGVAGLHARLPLRFSDPCTLQPALGCQGLECGVRNWAPAGGRLQGASEDSEVTMVCGQQDYTGHRFEKEKRFPENWNDFYIVGILDKMPKWSRKEFSRTLTCRF